MLINIKHHILYEWLIEQVNIYPDLKYSKIYWDNVYNNKEENR